MRIIFQLIAGAVFAAALTSCGAGEDAASSDSGNVAALQDLATGALDKLVIHEAPQPLPEVAVRVGLKGQPEPLAGLIDRPTLLNLWATWCAPCVKELPSLEALAQTHNGDDFQVIALNVERASAATVQAFLEKNGVTALGLVRDSKSTLPQALAARGLPVTLAIDANGDIRATLFGEAEWNGPEAQALVAAMKAGAL